MRCAIRVAAGVLLVVLLGAVPLARAGTPCEQVAPPEVATVQKVYALARKVVDQLDQSNIKVALIARVGQDLSKYNMRFSHLGFVVQNHPDGRWSVVHKLNQCATDQAGLYVQGLGNFFADNMFAYAAAIVVPPDEVQQKLVKLLVSPAQVKRFHEPKYNLVAYPFSTMYQNSNQWVLETLAFVMAPEGYVANRVEAQKWLKEAGYEPNLLKVRATTRLGGRMFKVNIAFDDHPGEYRWSNRIYVVGVDSVFDFVRKRYPQDSQRITVNLDN